MDTKNIKNFKEIDDFYEEELQSDLVLIQHWIEKQIISETQKPHFEQCYNQVFPQMPITRQSLQNHKKDDLNSYFYKSSHVSSFDPALKWQATESHPQNDPKVRLEEHVRI